MPTASSGLPAAAGERSVFLVVNYDSNGWGGFAWGQPAFNQAFGLGVAGSGNSQAGNLMAQGWFPQNDHVSNTSGNGAGWFSQSFVYDGSVGVHYADGAVIDSFNHTYNTNPQRIRLGVELNNNARIDMDVAEILVYDRALTAAERQSVDAYLQQTYFTIPNNPPVAVPDSYATTNGGTINTNLDSLPTVLANDTDVENDPLAAILVSPPSHGALTFNTDGSFTYVHNGSATTVDTFTYYADDSMDPSNSTTVTLNIAAPSNDPPVGVADAYSTTSGGTINTSASSLPSVLANDTDPNNDPLTALLVAGPSSGTLTLNANGSFVYTHNGSSTTTDSFTYRANDGQANSGVTTVSLSISQGGGGVPVTVGLVLHVRGDDGVTTSGASVDVWADQTSSGNNLTPIGGKPTLVSSGLNGHDYVSFDGQNDGLGLNALTNLPAGSNDRSVFLVVNYASIGWGGFAWGDVASNQAFGLGVSGAGNGQPGRLMAQGWFPQNDFVSSTLGNGAGWLTQSIVLASNQATHYADGSVIDTFTHTYATDPQRLRLGVELNNNKRLDMDVAEILVYDRALTTAERQSVEAYLEQTYFTAGNTPPSASNDSYSTSNGGTLNTTASSLPSVLANDTDPNNDPLTSVLVAGPSNGTLTLNANGSFVYTHNGSSTTSDSFTYRANDGQANSNLATVNISVAAPSNDPPVGVGDSYSTSNGGTINTTASSLPSVLANDTDPNNDPLTALLVGGPSNGTLTLNANGSFVYTHNGSSTTTDSFTYRANDGQANSGVTTVTLSIAAPSNDPPVGVADSYSTTNGGTINTSASSLPSVLANDTDPNNDPLTALLVGGPSNGTLTLNANGSFVYTHNGSSTTTDSFTYRANDGQANSGVTTVSLNIAAPSNDPPVGVADAYSTTSGGTINTSASSLPSVLANDTDPNNDPLTALLVGGPSNGTLTLNANGSFVYTHNGSSTTTDSFTYRANDGQANSGVTTVSLNIAAPSNDPPVGVADAYSTTSGGTINTSASSLPSVLANDTDPNNDPLTALLVGGPSSGTLTLNANGSFVYTHNGSSTTTDSFTYRANDGQANSGVTTVSLSISQGGGGVPVTVGLVLHVRGDDGVTTSGASVDVWADQTSSGNNLTPIGGKPTLVSNGLNGHDYVSFDGQNDGLGSNALTNLPAGSTDRSVFLVVNYASIGWGGFAWGDVASNQAFGLGVSGAGNGQPGRLMAQGWFPQNDFVSGTLGNGAGWLTQSIVLASNQATHYADGSVIDTFTHTYATDPQRLRLGVELNNNKRLDMDVAEILVYDRALTTAERQSVEAYLEQTYFTAGNTPPSASNDSYSTSNGGTLNTTASSLPSVLANDTDPNNDPLTSVLVAGPSNGTLTLNANGSFVYTHNGSSTTSDSFTYRANDGQANSNLATVNISVAAPSNDPPVGVGDSYSTSNGGTINTTASSLPSVLANDTDPNNDPLTALLVGGPSNGTLTLNANGSFVYTHNGSSTTTDSFTYRANDGQANSGVTTVTLNIAAPSNDPPVGVADSYSTTNGGTINTSTSSLPSVLANDTDPNNDPLTALLVGGPSNGTLTLNANGSFVYTHNGSSTTTDSFTYRANDGQVNSGVTTVSLSISQGGGGLPVTTGLVLHVRGDDGVTTSGSLIDVWADQTSSGNNLIPVGGKPTLVTNGLNGHDYVSFDGQNDGLGLNALTNLPAGSTDRSVFLVVNYDSNGWGGFAWGDTANNQAFGLGVSGFGNGIPGRLMSQGWFPQNDFVTTTAGRGQGWLTQSIVLGSNQATHYADGSAIDTYTHNYATDPQLLRLGVELNGSARINMDVAEILVYNRALTESERVQVEGYLQQAYFGGSNSAVVAYEPTGSQALLIDANDPMLTGTQGSELDDMTPVSNVTWNFDQPRARPVEASNQNVDLIFEQWQDGESEDSAADFSELWSLTEQSASV